MLKRLFKSRVLIAMLAALIIPFSGIVSCESDSDNSDEGYYISFTLNYGTTTTDYKYEKIGVDAELESDVPACEYTSGIRYYSEAYNTTDTEDYAAITFPNTIGEGGSFTEDDGEVDIYIKALNDGNLFSSYFGDGTCEGTVTEIGEVGGVVSGTFTGTLYAEGGTLTTITVTNGKFRVKRIADAIPMK